MTTTLNRITGNRNSVTAGTLEWLSNQDNKRLIEFVEINYYDELGILRKLVFQELNGQIITH